MRKHHQRRRRSCPLGGSYDPIGYCHYHKRTVSRQQLKNRKCLAKKCDRLQKYEGHPFWVAREKRKEQKKREERQETNREAMQSDEGVEVEPCRLAGSEGHPGSDGCSAPAFRPDDPGDPEGDLRYGD